MPNGVHLAARRGAASEETAALTRVVIGLTIAVGGLGGLIGFVAWDQMAVLALPTLVLVALLSARRLAPALWAAAAVWTTMLPAAHGEGMAGPLAMVAVCAAIAVGPARFWDFVERDMLGRRGIQIEAREGIEDL